MSAVQIEITHRFDGAATALLSKLIVALADAKIKPVSLVIGFDSNGNLKPKAGPADTPSSTADDRDKAGSHGPARKPGKPAQGKARRTKAEVAEDKAAAPAPVPEPPAAPKPLTVDDVRPRVRAYHKANGMDAAKAIFDGLSGGSLQTLQDPATEYAIVMERLDAVGAPAAGEPAAPKTPEQMG